MTEPLDIDHLRSWIGREDEASEVVTPDLVHKFRAMLDLPGGKPAPRRSCATLSSISASPSPWSPRLNSGPMAIRPVAGSCRRFLCRAACGPVASWSSGRTSGSATRSGASRALPMSC